MLMKLTPDVQNKLYDDTADFHRCKFPKTIWVKKMFFELHLNRERITEAHYFKQIFFREQKRRILSIC